MAMRILVIGAGGTGGYFGGRLAQNGRDVTFLVHGRRAETIRRDGLRIVSPHGDALIHPKLALAGEIGGFYDLILLSVKAYSLESAMDDFAPAVGPGTMILPMLNGMRHIERLQARFGEGPVLGGVCRISAEIDQEGRVVQLTGIEELIYGELRVGGNGGVSERMNALDGTLEGAGFDTCLSDNILREMWKKWIQLASLCGANCLMRGSIGEIEAAPGGAGLALQILEECAAIAAACGYPADESFLSRAGKMLTSPGSKLTSSMYRDLSQGSRVEADQILGDLLERGHKQGIAAPLLEAAFVNLRIYQARLVESGGERTAGFPAPAGPSVLAAPQSRS